MFRKAEGARPDEVIGAPECRRERRRPRYSLVAQWLVNPPAQDHEGPYRIAFATPLQLSGQ